MRASRGLKWENKMYKLKRTIDNRRLLKLDSLFEKKMQIETAITFHSFCSSSGSSKSQFSKSPESANFALTDMQHARERRRTSAVKFNSAVSYLVVPWDIWLCRELFGFAVIYLLLPVKVFGFTVSYLVLPWIICLCREIFGCAVRYLVVPWHSWATVGLYCSLILEDPTTLFQSEFDFLLFVIFLCRDLH